MGALPPDSTAGPAGGRLGADLAAHVEAIVHAAEREALAAERAIAEHRRSAEEEARRYLAAARLHVDAETAARAARIEMLSTATRRLADELTDAVAALTRELHADEQDPAAAAGLPRTPWPERAAPPPAPPSAPSWSRAAEPEGTRAGAEPEPPRPPADEPPAPHRQPVGEAAGRDTGGSEVAEPAVATNGTADVDLAVPSAARLVAIEMAVGGSSRAEVEEHLREQLGVGDPQPLLDDVFGAASHAGSRLAWGEP